MKRSGYVLTVSFFSLSSCSLLFASFSCLSALPAQSCSSLPFLSLTCCWKESKWAFLLVAASYGPWMEEEEKLKFKEGGRSLTSSSTHLYPFQTLLSDHAQSEVIYLLCHMVLHPLIVLQPGSCVHKMATLWRG